MASTRPMSPSIDVPLPAPAAEERNLAMLAQLLGLFGILAGGIGHVICPLVMYFVKRDESPFVAFHALQAGCFQLLMTVGVVLFSMFALMTCVLIPAIPLAVLAWIFFSILGAAAAQKGEWSRFPVVGTWCLQTVLDRHATAGGRR